MLFSKQIKENRFEKVTKIFYPKEMLYYFLLVLIQILFI